MRAMLMVKVEESWCGRRYDCLPGVYFTTKFITAKPWKNTGVLAGFHT